MIPCAIAAGGAEHAVLHLLYARFWHKVLYDLGVVSTPEPFQRLVSQGMILGEVGMLSCYLLWYKQGCHQVLDAASVPRHAGGVHRLQGWKWPVRG